MKNLSLYEKIDRVCRLGKHAIVQDASGDYLLVSPFQDKYKNWRYGMLDESVQAASQYIADDIGLSENEWKERERLGDKYIGVWTPPAYERFEVGDKVINTLCISLYHGDTGVIDEVEYGHKYRVRFPSQKKLNEFCYVELLHEHLEPVFEEEEIVEVLGKKYKKSELEKRLQELEEVEA